MIPEEAIEELKKEVLSKVPEKKIKKIRQRIIAGEYPRTRAQAQTAEAFNDYIGAGLFWGLISATRRNSHWQARDDVLYSLELLDIDLPDRIMDLPGLELAEVWAGLLVHL